MKIAKNEYGYNARHGEYMPEVALAEEWYADWKEMLDAPYVRPGWVTEELVEQGFGPDEEGDPQGEYYIRLECDEAGLMNAIRSLFTQIGNGPAGGDDDTYDYWPSGVILFSAMGADLEDASNRAEFEAMLAEVPSFEEYESESGKLQSVKDIERQIYGDLGLIEPKDLE